jgi:Gpi18-like mannosyltransferase
VWITIIALTVILAFSYNAFSYDIFNYIFDAKIFTNYHQNPYLFKALDFPNDPMLAFMHWTQRTYPYGPTWLLVSVPLSFLGLQYFLPTFFLFKLLAALCFIGTAYMIGKIMQTIAPKEELFSLVFFALNPLVIVEALISGHNDIVMMFLAMVSLYFLIKRKYVLSFLFFFFSIGIKYATGFLLPLYATIVLFDRKKVSVNWQAINLTFIAEMIFGVIAATLRTNFQPWYLLFILPFAAVVARRFYIIIPTLIMTLAALLNYLPFLYTGNWDPPIPQILNDITLGGVVLSALVCLVIFLLKKQRKHIVSV